VSLLTALGYYMGSQGKAKRDNAAVQSTNAYNQRSLDLEQQRFGAEQQQQQTRDAETKRLNDVNIRAQGYDPATGQLAPLPVLPKGLTQISPGNKGKGAPSTDDLFRHEMQLADYYDSQGRPDLAKARRDAAQAYALGASREAAAGLSGARGQEITQGKIPEEQARAQYWKGKLGVDLQVAQTRVRAAEIAGNAHVRAAQVSADGALARAGVSAQAQIAGHIAAGYYALQGRSAQDATQMAITDARNAENYASTIGKKTGEFPETQPLSVQNFITPGAQVDPTASTAALLQVLAPLIRNGGAAPAQPAPRPSNGGTAPNPALKQFVASMRQNKQSDAAIRAFLKGKDHSDQEINALLGGSSKPQPLPVPSSRYDALRF
jgi:hypothetical protein